MEIAEVRAFPINTQPTPKTKPRVQKRSDALPIVSPLNRYQDLPAGWPPHTWSSTACTVTAKDGTWGFGLGSHSGPVNRIIEDHLAPLIVGQNCMATERLFDIMQRATIMYGTVIQRLRKNGNDAMAVSTSTISLRISFWCVLVVRIRINPSNVRSARSKD